MNTKGVIIRVVDSASLKPLVGPSHVGVLKMDTSYTRDWWNHLNCPERGCF